MFYEVWADKLMLVTYKNLKLSTIHFNYKYRLLILLGVTQSSVVAQLKSKALIITILFLNIA